MKSSTLLLAFAASASAIWPYPETYYHGTDVMWMSSNIPIRYHGPGESKETSQSKHRRRKDDKVETSGSSTTNAKDIVDAAIDRAHNLIFTQNFVPWKFYARNSNFEPDKDGKKNYINQIDIYQTATDRDAAMKPLAGEVDESHNLTISDDGRVKMSAVSHVGVLRALETFSQLFFQHSQCQDVYTGLAPVTIYDKPKFQHRGLNLDVARNWFPVKNILHTIDAIAWNKFNRLHLHITDSQSWPLEIPALPELAKQGAYQKGLSYSPDDLKQIQSYGVERGVEVILEIDMPGHTASIALSQPDLITAYNVQPDWTTFANEPPSGQLKLNNAEVDSFIGKLFDDLLPRVSPYSAYFHTGGDELNVNAYLLDEGVKSNDSKVIQPYLQAFIDKAHSKIREQGLVPMVWEEMLLQWNLTLGEDVVVQTWQSDAAVADTVSKGHKALAGNYNYWYLDCGKGQWVSPRENMSMPSVIAEPFTDYCSPVKSWRQMYSYDPLHDIPAANQHLVLGGEVHMWTEQTDPVNLDEMIWPRAAAAAEVLWSGRQDATGTNRSLIAAAPRLAQWREHLVARGVQAGPVQMIWCTANDPNDCAE